MSAPLYYEAASVFGVWAHDLRATSPAVPLTAVADEIAQATRRTGVPLTAYAHTTGQISTRMVLVRDPSAAHGVPDLRECERAVQELVAGGTWRSNGQLVRSAVLVAIGFREGYAPGNRVHTMAEFKARHSLVCPVWAGSPAELISARKLDTGAVRTYREPGVLTFSAPEELPALAAIAAEFRQHRFLTHDWLSGYTSAFRRVIPASGLAGGEES